MDYSHLSAKMQVRSPGKLSVKALWLVPRSPPPAPPASSLNKWLSNSTRYPVRLVNVHVSVVIVTD